MARIRRFRRFPRFRRFRRSSKGTWFPVLGTNWGPDPNSDFTYQSVSFSGQSGEVENYRNVGPTQNVFAITRDITQFSDTDTALAGPSLRDIVEGNSWRLNRIVGQLQVDATEANTAINQAWPLVQVAAGFFVARTGDFDESLPDLTYDEIDPLNARNAQNPWIWRRTWLLGRPLASNVGWSANPSSNQWLSGEVGSQIDSRVKRNIVREKRLWFVIAAQGWDGQLIANVPPEGITQPYIRFNLDIRIHGVMKRGRNQGDF